MPHARRSEAGLLQRAYFRWREEQVLDVRDFGATGDGVTDDTAAIQDALNSASFRMPVYFPTGIYSVSSGIDITRNKLIGDPPVLGGLLDYDGSTRITQAGGS